MPLALPTLDLKWSLTLRVMAATIACFLIAVTLSLFESYWDARLLNENVANLVARQLQTELFRIDSNIGLPAEFPDWDPVVELIQTPGQCIQYVKPDGHIGRSNCVGFARDSGAPPAWFSALGTWLLAGRTDVARHIGYHEKIAGTLVVTTEPAAVLSAIWKNVSGLLQLAAMFVIATCVLQYLAISRTLRPTKQILAALDRLAGGDLSCRLPSFQLAELQRISDGFNTLAASLESSMGERAALAARLVDRQEQERLNLARELHDELAQTLSAMSAVAASIKATAEHECPALVPAADNLAQTAIGMARFLRTTLRTLRPPEIDDLGLAASLAALAKEQERRADGRLKISLTMDDLQSIPPTAAAHIYRIVQEGLTNIGKHANASLARIELSFQEDISRDIAHRRWLTLIIEDNGSGPVSHRIQDEGHGLGLIGMRERVTALGGQLDVIHPPYRGFKLQATIPFEPTAELAQ